MSSAAKTILIGAVGLLLALFFGALLGQDSYLLPLGIVGILAAAFIHFLLFRQIAAEALITGFLIIGYIVGNRGFAQLSLGGPLFFGELGMAACVTLLLVRLALTRRSPIPKTPLAWSISALIVLGAVRLYLDVVVHLSGAPTLVAVRDSAVIYYALFFFIAFQAGMDERARRFIERCILTGCILLLPIVVIQLVAPALLMRLTFRGNPLIYQKGDLLTIFLAFSVFYFFVQSTQSPRRNLWLVLSLMSFAGMLLFSQRAGLVGFALAAILMLFARQGRFLGYQLATAMVGLLIYLALQASNLQHESAWIAQFTDKIESITDYAGTHNYRGTEGEVRSENNQFRLVWWTNVYKETMQKAPFFGLGFGYDLAQSFVRDYYANRGEFETRSPHSIWVTMLGRMGVIGLVCFTILIFLLVHAAFTAASKVASRRAHPHVLGHWCAALILLGGATFGVVLEGPMGGVLFWSFLGLAGSGMYKPARKDLSAPVEKHRVNLPTSRPALTLASPR